MNAPDLLSSILSSFGTPPPKAARKPAPKKAKPAPDTRPLPQSFAFRKTGYVVWTATARVLQVQKQICKCCGGEIEYIKNEFFALENGNAHATWLRPEGYGIKAPEDLPNTFVDLEPVYVTACAQCRSTPFDDLDLLFHPKQLSLDL